MIEIIFDTHGLEEKLERAAVQLERLPEDPGENPCALALYDYQAELATANRPTVGQSGSVGGESWPALAPQYVRKDGTIVPVYGGVPHAHGKGVVKGKIKSAGVGSGSGSRYQAGDRQLGDRAGGLWSDWISQRATLQGLGRIAKLASPFIYAWRQFKRRPWWGNTLELFTQKRLELRADDYIQGVLREEGLA